MKMYFKIFVAFLCSISFFSCAAVKNVALSAASDSLAGADKNGKIPLDVSNNEMMFVLTGEEDPQLMADFFPTALKLYEIMYVQNPTHQGLASMLGSLYVMYANAFVQIPAEMMGQTSDSESEFKRAKIHYIRGFSYALKAFAYRYPGFEAAYRSSDSSMFNQYLFKLDKNDVSTAYWIGAGNLGAMSVDLTDASVMKTVGSAVLLLERAAEIDPFYNKGAIWDVLCAYYAGMGLTDKALSAWKMSEKASGGEAVGTLMTYATVFCINNQDADEFRKTMKKIIAIDPDKDPMNRLSTIIFQKKAAYMLEHIDDYILVW